MIKIEKNEIYGWEAAIRGMRNPLNSWDKSDSLFFDDSKGDLCTISQKRAKSDFSFMELGENDLNLMKRLVQVGTDHRKFMRMIAVYVDVTAPLYWWKEYDTYKVGTVANSCSTMHKIHEKEFTVKDFSYEHLIHNEPVPCRTFSARQALCVQVEILNMYRELFLETKDKKYWWQIIQLLPSSYNQKRTVMLNYEVLANIYHSRKNHKLDEWHTFCKWIETLPYSEIITGGKPNDNP
jgi:hypothetical protein